MVELSACIHGMFPLLSYQSLAEWLAWFRDVYGHEGACLDSGQVRRKYIFELYIPVCQRTKAESGFFVPALPPWLWEYYNTVKFQKLYLRTADQLFAAAFALWYGLPERACRLITGRSHAQSACDILHALLCGMDCDDVERVLRDRSRKPEERRRVLAFAPYPGRYIICHDRGDISARRDGEALIALDTGERFSLHTEP